MEGPVVGHLAVHPKAMVFMIDHDIDPVAPEGFLPFAAVEETVCSHQPFEVRNVFNGDEEELMLAVDTDFAVANTTRTGAPNSE